MAGEVASTVVQLHWEPEGPVAYELISTTNDVRFDASGSPSRGEVSVSAFRLSGDSRSVLPVNSQTGAAHIVALVISGGAAASRTLSTGVYATALRSASWARFDLVHKSKVSMSGTTPVYADIDVLASIPVAITHDGSNGTNGSFVSTVFVRCPSKPDAPTGGKYTSPYPTSTVTVGTEARQWTDAPPTGTDPIWISRAVFNTTHTSDSNAPAWSTPVMAVDSNDVEFIWSKTETRPNPPTSHPFDGQGDVWSKNATDAVWMAVAVKRENVWGDWEVSRVKGETGKTGESAVYATVSPSVVEMKKGVLGYRAYVDVYDGGTLADCNDVTYPWLMNVSPGGWLIASRLRYSFGVDGSRFYYQFDYFPTGEVNMDIAVTVTYKGKGYPVTIPLRSIADGEKGEKGESAVQYSLVASPTSVTFDLNEGKYDTALLKVKVLKTDGETTTEVGTLPSGMMLQYELYQGGVLKSTVYCPGKQVSLSNADVYSRIDWVLKQGTQEIARETVGVTLTGINGTNGKNGVWVPPPMEWEDYPTAPTAYQFQAGDVSNGDVRLDMVLTRNSDGKLFLWQCIQTHVKGASGTLAPGVQPNSNGDNGYWRKADSGVWKFVATELLWANIGQINFLSGQAFRVGDADGMCGYFGTPTGGAVFYSGGAEAGNATFVVYKDGKVVARYAEIEGSISASTLDLKVSTSAEGTVPNGALCFDVNSIKLPALTSGSVRTIKVYNPLRTRTAPSNLSLIPENSTVKISTNLKYVEATSSTKSLAECGQNGECYLELLGINIGGTTTWTVAKLN